MPVGGSIAPQTSNQQPFNLGRVPAGRPAWPQGWVLPSTGVQLGGDGGQAQALAAEGLAPELAHQGQQRRLTFDMSGVRAVGLAPLAAARLLPPGLARFPQLDDQPVLFELVEHALDLEQRLARRVGKERLAHVLARVGGEEQRARVDAALDEHGLDDHVARQPVQGLDDDHGRGRAGERRGGMNFRALFPLLALHGLVALAQVQDQALPLGPVGLGAGVSVAVHGGERAAVFLGPRAAGCLLALEAVAVFQRLPLAGNPQIRDGHRAGGRFLKGSSAAHALSLSRLLIPLHTNSEEFVYGGIVSAVRKSAVLGIARSEVNGRGLPQNFLVRREAPCKGNDGWQAIGLNAQSAPDTR